MIGLLLYQQTQDTNWPKVIGWKDELHTLLAEEEAALIEGIQKMTAHVGYYYGLDKLGKDRAVISQAVIEKLREELKRQAKAIDRLEKAVATQADKLDNISHTGDDELAFDDEDD